MIVPRTALFTLSLVRLRPCVAFLHPWGPGGWHPQEVRHHAAINSNKFGVASETGLRKGWSSLLSAENGILGEASGIAVTDIPPPKQSDNINEEGIQTVTPDFVNDGPLSWMTTYLDAMGIQEGKAIYYGPIPGDVDDSKRPSDEEAAALRRQASQELVNINRDERQRRDQAGSVMTALSIAYVTWASLLADDGGLGGHALRLLSAIPLFLAVGYKRSAATGLCNVAQAGLWDVDGNGLTKIEDPSLARALLDRVNNMNFDTLVKVVAPVTVFALVPQSTSAPLAFFLVLFSLLYAFRDKLSE